jgi:hypothetical protein
LKIIIYTKICIENERGVVCWVYKMDGEILDVLNIDVHAWRCDRQGVDFKEVPVPISDGISSAMHPVHEGSANENRENSKPTSVTAVAFADPGHEARIVPSAMAMMAKRSIVEPPSASA